MKTAAGSSFITLQQINEVVFLLYCMLCIFKLLF